MLITSKLSKICMEPEQGYPYSLSPSYGEPFIYSEPVESTVLKPKMSFEAVERPMRQ